MCAVGITCNKTGNEGKRVWLKLQFWALARWAAAVSYTHLSNAFHRTRNVAADGVAVVQALEQAGDEPPIRAVIVHFDFLPDDTPVSYTHLDVYKRQVFTLCKNEKYGQLIENLENVEDSVSQMADFALIGQTVAQQISMLAGLTAEDADAALQHLSLIHI